MGDEHDMAEASAAAPAEAAVLPEGQAQVPAAAGTEPADHIGAPPQAAAAPEAEPPAPDDPGQASVGPAASDPLGPTAADPVAPDPDELSRRAGERDEYLALAQRTRADFENYRKRVTRDAAAAESRTVARVVRDLLPAIDNLERALAAASADIGGVGDQAGLLLDGMRLVRDDLHGALGRAGVESYTPQGERFDPELHEAIAQHEVAGATPGTVIEVYQAGYRLNGSLIRPARVVVAGGEGTAAPVSTPDGIGGT